MPQPLAAAVSDWKMPFLGVEFPTPQKKKQRTREFREVVPCFFSLATFFGKKTGGELGCSRRNTKKSAVQVTIHIQNNSSKPKY